MGGGGGGGVGGRLALPIFKSGGQGSAMLKLAEVYVITNFV